MGALDDALATLLAGGGAPPGAVVGVSHHGRRVWRSGGFAQVFDERGPLPEPLAMSEHVVSDLGSVTKVLATTAALMTLVGDGGLSLSTPVSDLMPQTRGRPAGGATLERLLAHRAGLWEWWPVYLEARGNEAALERVASLPLRYAAGAAFHYSDLGFMLLGAAVEAAAGATLAEAVRARILEPQALSRVWWAHPPDGSVVAASSNGDAIEREMIASGRPYPVTAAATGTTRWREHVLVGEVNDGNAFHAFDGVAGHAGLFAPATELLRFGEGLLASLAGRGPLAPGVLRRFLAPGPDAHQGLGFRLWPEFGAAGHLGFPGVGVAIVPEREVAVAMVTNRLHLRGTAPRPTDEMFRTVLGAALRTAGEELAWT